MDPNQYDDELRTEELVGWCIRDRDQLRKEFFVLHPGYEGLPPALWVESILGALGYRVAFRPMGKRELGLCDVENRQVFINVELDIVRRHSTMAHELGHARLHERELKGLAFGGQVVKRAQQRENEANVYAAIFLVCRDELERHDLVCDLLKSRRAGDDMESDELWRAVYKLAKDFHVSPTLMMKCLFGFGWIEKVPARRGSRRKNDLKLKRRVDNE